MKDATSVLGGLLMGELSVDMCEDVLMWSGRCGMRQLKIEALQMAAGIASTAGFMRS
jgi:hypothetical protein